MKSFLLILLLITTSMSWANPQLNPSCENKITDELLPLRILIRNYKSSFTLSALNKKNVNHVANTIFQTEAPEYASPKWYNTKEILDLLKMKRIQKISEENWRGELAGVLFLTKENQVYARLEVNAPKRYNSPAKGYSLDAIRIRLSSEDASSAKDLIEFARISQAVRINVEPNLTFCFKFHELASGAAFINYVKKWLKQHRHIKFEKIPFALESEENIYIGNPDLESDFIMPIQDAYKNTPNASEEEILKDVLNISKFDFHSGLRQQIDIDSIRTLLKVDRPPFAPTSAYEAQLGDLSKLPAQAKARILHMAATMEQLDNFPAETLVDLVDDIPKQEPLKTYVTEMIRLLRDTKEFGIFLGDLMRETALLIQSEGAQEAQQKLAQGIFSRKYVYKILERWNAEEGLRPFHKVNKNLSPDEFRRALKEGLFIDPYFGNANTFHGIDVHIMQMMFLSRRMIPKYGPGTIRQFLEYVTASDAHEELWGKMVDHTTFHRRSNHTPEIFTQLYTPYVELH